MSTGLKVLLALGGGFLAVKLLSKKKNATQEIDPETGKRYHDYYHIYVSTIPVVKAQGGRTGEYINIYDEVNDKSFWLTTNEAEEYIAERKKNPLYVIVYKDVKVLPVEDIKQMLY